MLVRRATLGEIVALRHRELRAGLPRTSAAFDGDDEPATIHTGAFDGDDVVGCASWMCRPYDGARAYQLRGMATRADRVGGGIGRAVLRFGEHEVATTTGIHLLWCNARVPAVAFYERLGWRVVSEPFDVPTAGPHRVMRRDLPVRS